MKSQKDQSSLQKWRVKEKKNPLFKWKVQLEVARQWFVFMQIASGFFLCLLQKQSWGECRSVVNITEEIKSLIME